MKPKQNRYKYTVRDKRRIEEILKKESFDKDVIKEAISGIEHLITIYRKAWDRDQSQFSKSQKLGPKKRKFIIESVLAGKCDAPDWLDSWLVPGQEKEILECMLNLSELKRGRPKDYIWNFLIKALADLYFNYIGKKPTITWRGDKDRYSGKFYTFVEACINPPGIIHRKDNKALGKSIKRVLLEMDFNK